MSETALEKVTYTADELRSVTSFADLGELFAAHGTNVANVGEVLGDGFSLLSTDAKKTLEGEEFVIIDWSFTEGDNGEFVTIRLITRAGDRKLIVNDGSTGIRDQMRSYAARSNQPLYVPRGLRRSDYTYVDPSDGKDKRATTYYLDTASRAA